MSRSKPLPFITCDKALAAALITKGFKLQNRFRLGRKPHFSFYGAESLRPTIELYWNDRLPLNARTLLAQYQTLTGTTHDQER